MTNKMKNTAKLSQSALKKMIEESVRRCLKEGTTSQDALQKWEDAKNILGADQMLDAFQNYMSSDQIDQMLEWLNDDYELW